MSAPTLCSRCESELEAGDLRCPVCSAARDAGAPLPEVPQVQVLRCSDCNAVMKYDPAHQAAACPFCGEKLELERPTDPVEEAQEFVPFAFDQHAAMEAIEAWFKKKPFFAPGDLAQRARIQDAKPVLWAAWIVSGQSKVHFTADEDGAGYKATYGPRVGNFDRPLQGLLVPATRGLTIEEIASLHDFDLSTAAAAPPAGVLLEDYGVTRSAARAAIGEAVRNDALATVLQNATRRLRGVKAEVLLSKLRTRRVLLPAWVAAYRYGDRLYRVVLHGQYPTSIVGKTPLSWLRVAAVAGAVLAALLVAAFFLSRR